ncbi:MAG: DNA polymerase III subunit delta [Elusimicrobia bacterium]|nr:DNA polymerase III subunit delta [Elusimicrobiota bacterium]
MDLRPQDLLKEIKSGRLRPVYYLFGEEASAKAAALDALKAHFKSDAFNLVEFSGDPDQEAAAVVSECSTLPVFAERRLVIVANPKIPAAARAALAEYLKDPLLSTTLVLLSEDRKPDAKDALSKAASAAGALCTFSPLREEEAVERLKAAARTAGKVLSDEAAAALVAEAGTDWGVLSQELEKALLYAAQKPSISGADALAVLGYRKAADPFALSRMIQSRQLKASLIQARRVMSEGKADEQAFRVLSQINSAVTKQLKAKRMLKAGLAPDAILRNLRLNAWYDKDFLAQAQKLSDQRLLRDLKRCLETDTDLKSKAWLDPRIELERLVVDLCRPDYLAAARA